MKCPKCDIDIDDKMLVCPNCKKVLKLLCPKCKTVNKSNTCKKCGFTIVTKCNQCGKINQTISGKCSKCGFSTYKSVAINSSDIDEFACLTVEFPNVDELKAALGSTKLFDKFKASLDKRMNEFVASIGLVREVINDIYVVKFNKDFSFATSASNAMKAAIEIQNSIMELNFKLDKAKGVTLQGNIAVLKRDINSMPEDFQSGFEIKLMYQNSKKLRLLNNLQVITDSDIYGVVCDEYSLSTLSSAQIKGAIVMFFELNLKKYVQIPKELPKEVETEEIVSLPKFNNTEADTPTKEADEIYNIEVIDFEEIKCKFIKTKSISLISEIVNQFQQNKKSVLSVKCDKALAPKTLDLIDAIETSKTFDAVYRVTCCDEMKYKPYGFFYELISSLYNYTQSPKLFSQNDFGMWSEIDPSGLIKDFISLNLRELSSPEDVRFELFDIFYNIFYSMANSLVYIENIENMDDTSLEVLQIILEKFDTLDLSLLALGDKDFTMHKNYHFLLAQENYTEIITTTTPFEEIIGSNAKKYQPLAESHYIQKIAEYTKGSAMYFYQVIDYLAENHLLELKDNVFEVTTFKNILIPPTLDELIVKRLKHLAKDNETAYKLFAMFLLIGTRVDFGTLELLNIPDDITAIQDLIDKDYVYQHNNAFYIQNYNLYREAFFKNVSLEFKQMVALELLDKIFSSDVTTPTEAILYKILQLGKNEFETWVKLSHVNTSMGDFSAYLNCSIKFLKLLKEIIPEDGEEAPEKTVEDYKTEVFENISNLLYKYSPEKIQNVAPIILENLENSRDAGKAVYLCYKMVQGCLISGNYSQALKLINKIFSKAPNASINPKDEFYNIAFFLISLIKIEVLFSTGDLQQCVDFGEEILKVLTEENLPDLKPEDLAFEQFRDSIFDVMGFVAISKILLLQDDLDILFNRLKSIFGTIPKNAELYSILKKTITGEKVSLENIDLEKLKGEKFSKSLFNILRAFNEDREDYKKFAEDIYQAKMGAKADKLYQVELICDLLIGYAYFNLGEDKKSEYIYNNALETGSKNGLKLVIYTAWYLISTLKFRQDDIKIAHGIANNAAIQLEKDSNSSELLLLLFKMTLAKILAVTGEELQAEMCLKHVNFIQNKYGILKA